MHGEQLLMCCQDGSCFEQHLNESFEDKLHMNQEPPRENDGDKKLIKSGGPSLMNAFMDMTLKQYRENTVSSVQEEINLTILSLEEAHFYIILDFQLSKKFNNRIHKFLRYATNFEVVNKFVYLGALVTPGTSD
jgi:hypothetical protein